VRLAVLLAVFALSLAWSQAEEDSTNVAPPDLPLYDQPPMPAFGYVWTPGYWAWSDDDQDFFWVPGTWVPAPQPEFLWTPGYWEVVNAVYFWHVGFWGRHLGFYGGINYGYGYAGSGAGHVSFLGGTGVHAQPTAAQIAAANERHIGVTPLQQQQIAWARTRPALHASQNQGVPPIGATPKPGVGSGPGVSAARAASVGGAPSYPTPRPGGTPPAGQAPAAAPRTAPTPYKPPHSAAPPTPPHPAAPPTPPHPAAPQSVPHPAEHPADHSPEH